MIKIDIKEKLTSIITLLSIPGVGSGRYHKLIKKFSSIENIFTASVNQLEEIPGISHALAGTIKNNRDENKAKEIAAKIIQLGWNIHFHNEPSFPKQFYSITGREIPPLLFSIGKEIKPDDKLIAIVGSRHATEKGKQFAYQLAQSLVSSNIIVVSGMAEGIDSAAHKGTLDSSGHTVAIWGASLDKVYPPSNKTLAEQIAQTGTVFSEYLPDTPPDRAHFPQRNRLIAGLSDGIVVVEAGQKSGALITANLALTYEKELFAVPGAPAAKLSLGTNQLIKNGAKLLTSVDVIFDELPRLKGNIRVRQFKQMPDLTEIERKLVKLFSEGPQQVDKISRTVNLSVPELMEFLLALELKGIVKELSGKRFILSEEYI